MKFLKNSKGFTLAEMLIVMAVVVVLAAAAMPAVKGQVETARESIDIDTVRAAYSAAYTQAYMDYNGKTGSGNSAQGGLNTDGYEMAIKFVQTEAGWRGSNPVVGGKALESWPQSSSNDVEPSSITKVTIVFGEPANGSESLATTSIALGTAS